MTSRVAWLVLLAQCATPAAVIGKAAAPKAPPVPVFQDIASDASLGSFENESLPGAWTDAPGGRSVDPSGRFLLFTERTAVGILDLETGRVRGRQHIAGRERRSTAFDQSGDYAFVFGEGGWAAWDLRNDTIAAHDAARAKTSVDDVHRTILEVSGGQIWLRAVDGSIAAGPVPTSLSQVPIEVHIGLGAENRRWILADSRRLEVRDSQSLALVAEQTSPRIGQLFAVGRAPVFVLAAGAGVDVYDAESGALRRRIAAPHDDELAADVRLSSDDERLLVAWEAELAEGSDDEWGEPEDVWQEHELYVYRVEDGSIAAHTERARGSVMVESFEPVVLYSRSDAESEAMRWEPGHDPTADGERGRAMADARGQLAALLSNPISEGALEIVRGRSTVRVAKYNSYFPLAVSFSPFENGVLWNRGPFPIAISAHGATHFPGHSAGRVRWLADGTAVRCLPAGASLAYAEEPMPACTDEMRATGGTSLGPVVLAERDDAYLVFRRDESSVRVEAYADESFTRRCLIVREADRALADCEPGQVLMRGPGHVLRAALDERVSRGAAARLAALFEAQRGD